MAPRQQSDVLVNKDGMASFQNPDTGEFLWVPKANIRKAMEHGLKPESSAAFYERKLEEQKESQAPYMAFGAGLASSMTLGASDALIEHYVPGTVKEARERAPTAGLAGDIAGMLMPGGAVSGAGKVGAKVAGKIATKSATKALTRLGATVGRGVAEGATVGSTSAISQQAQMGNKFNAAEIAKAAALGAGIGGAVSLAGAGLAAVGRRAKRATDNLAKRRSGTPERSVDDLMAQHKAIQSDLSSMSRLLGEDGMAAMAKLQSGTIPKMASDGLAAQVERKLSGWTPKSGVPVTQLEGKLAELGQQVSTVRKAAFKGAGGRLNALNMGLGLAVGVPTESFLMGAVGVSAGSLLQSSIGRRIVTPTINLGARALPTIGRPAKLAGIKMLSQGQVSSISERLGSLSPEGLYQDALAGYAEAGVQPEMVQELATFHRNRAQLLKDAFVTSGSPIVNARLSKLYNAAEDPRRITARLKQGKLTKEDVEVLGKLMPRMLTQLQDEARSILEEQPRKLKASHRQQLKMLLNPDARRRHAQTVQAVLAHQEQGRPAPINLKQPKGQALPIQRIQNQEQWS